MCLQACLQFAFLSERGDSVYFRQHGFYCKSLRFPCAQWNPARYREFTADFQAKRIWNVQTHIKFSIFRNPRWQDAPATSIYTPWPFFQLLSLKNCPSIAWQKDVQRLHMINYIVGTWSCRTLGKFSHAVKTKLLHIVGQMLIIYSSFSKKQLLNQWIRMFLGLSQSQWLCFSMEQYKAVKWTLASCNSFSKQKPAVSSRCEK